MSNSTVHHIRQIRPNRLETLLGSLSLKSLRNVYKNCSPLNDKIPKEKSKKEDIIKLISRTSNLRKDELINIVYEQEAKVPFKHLVFFAYSGAYSNFEELTRNNKIDNDISFSYYHETDKAKVYTFEHKVQSTVWEWSRTGGHYPREIEVRHPLVLNVYKSNYITVSYPGFSKSRENKKQIEYKQVLQTILDSLKESLSIDFHTFNIKPVISTLLKKKSSRLVFTRIKSEDKRGRFDLRASDSTFSIEALLPSLMSSHLPNHTTQEIELALAMAINSCSSSTTIISWKDEKISTNIRYHSIGTELFIFWNNQEQEYEKIIRILQFLINISKLNDERESILNIFFNSQQDQIFTFDELVSISGATSSQTKKEIALLVSNKVVQPMYRLKTEYEINDQSGDGNLWKDTPLSLIKEFEVINPEDGSIHTIDGSNAENILVAFTFSHSKDEQVEN